jgi:hypothetical protein
MRMKRKILVVFLAVMFIPLTCAGGFAEMNVGDYSLGGYISLGGGFLADPPKHRNRGYLEEYRPFPKGFLADTDLSLKSKDGLEYYRFQMSNPGLRDQDFLLQAGKYGVYHTEVEYDQLQHLYCTANPYQNDIRIMLQRLRLSGIYMPTPDIDLFVENIFLRRTGQQPATYVGGPNNGGYTFSTYLRPIGYSQNDMKAGMELTRSWYQFRVAYHLSTFNEDTGIDNPAVRTGVVVTLPPSNMANYLTAEGALKLDTYMTRITSSFSYGWLAQDDFVFATNGNQIGHAGLSASTVAADLSGVTRPIAPLTLRYSYRAYDFANNNTNNSILRSAFSGDNQPLLKMEQYSYLRQTFTGGADYKVNSKLALDFAYAYQRLDRDHGQGHTSSNSPQMGIRVFPTSWLTLTANYAYVNRKGSDFLVLAPGEVLTYKAYSGDLKRNKVSFIAEVFPLNNVAFSFNYSFYNDDFNNSGYGLHNGQGWSSGADVSWRPSDRVAFALGYDHQQAVTKELAPIGPNRGPGGSIFGTPYVVGGDAGPLLVTSDSYDTFTARADFQIIPKKLKLTNTVSYSFSRSYFHNNVMPNLREGFADINTSLTYKINEHWGCRVGYIFEIFTMTKAYQELYLNGIPSTVNQSLNTLDGFYRNATAHLFQGFLQYRF